MRFGALIAVIAVGAPLAARGDPALGISAQVTSDYVVRGLSQTRGQGAVQGGLQVDTRSGAFAGVWASSVIFDPAAGRQGEYDVYAGHRWDLVEDVAARLSVARYVYPQDARELRYDYTEFAATLDWRDRVAATLAWSPDTSRYSYAGVARHRTSRSIEISLRQPLGSRMHLLGSASWQDLHDLFGTGYWAGSAGIALDLERFSASLSWFTTDAVARRLFGDDVAGQRWAATVTWRFRAWD